MVFIFKAHIEISGYIGQNDRGERAVSFLMKSTTGATYQMRLAAYASGVSNG